MMAEHVLTNTHGYIRFLEATSTKAGMLHPSLTFSDCVPCLAVAHRSEAASA